jgi:hypothetical protein
VRLDIENCSQSRSIAQKASQKTFCAAQTRSMHVYPRIGYDRLTQSQVAQPANLSRITCSAMRPVGVCFIEPYNFILHSNHKNVRAIAKIFG